MNSRVRTVALPAVALLAFAAAGASDRAAASAEATPRVIPRAGQFHGKTAQSWNLNFKVSVDGKRIRPFATSVTLVCRISGTYTETRPFLPPGSATIRKDGSFKRTVSPGDGTTYTYRGRFTSSRKASGTLTMGSSKLAYGGLEVCVIPGGNVRWLATRR